MTPPPACLPNAPGLWRLPKPDARAHKYMRGHVLVLGGQENPGAARLAALAALRAGAGVVTIGWPEQNLTAPAHAVMTRIIENGAALSAFAHERKVSAFVLGPGSGADKRLKACVEAALATGLPAVLDADVFSLPLPKLHSACVLTPHEGEFKRAFAFTGDKPARACAAAVQSGAVVLLKGADTVIASPEGRAALNTNAPPWLATAGAGDVLSGIIGALLAQGMPAFDAACAGAWLHGEAAQRGGPGLIADDLPGLLRDLL